MTPILINARMGAVSGWINRNGYEQIRFPDSGRFSVTERSIEGASFESQVEHLPVVTLAGDTKWVKIKYLDGKDFANVELF